MMLGEDQMELALGLVMKESRVKLPITHLVDPHAALRGIRRGKRMLPVLLWRRERPRKKLSRGAGSPPNLPPPQTTIGSRTVAAPGRRAQRARPLPHHR